MVPETVAVCVKFIFALKPEVKKYIYERIIQSAKVSKTNVFFFAFPLFLFLLFFFMFCFVLHNNNFEEFKFCKKNANFANNYFTNMSCM